MLKNCCAFTGHRPHKFPWKQDETDSRCVALKAVLLFNLAMLKYIGEEGVAAALLVKYRRRYGY